jgi:hypothetical protein
MADSCPDSRGKRPAIRLTPLRTIGRPTFFELIKITRRAQFTRTPPATVGPVHDDDERAPRA